MNQNSTVTKETGRDPLGNVLGAHLPGLGAMVQQMDNAFLPMSEAMAAMAREFGQIEEALRPARAAFAAMASEVERAVGPLQAFAQNLLKSAQALGPKFLAGFRIPEDTLRAILLSREELQRMLEPLRGSWSLRSRGVTLYEFLKVGGDLASSGSTEEWEKFASQFLRSYFRLKPAPARMDALRDILLDDEWRRHPFADLGQFLRARLRMGHRNWRSLSETQLRGRPLTSLEERRQKGDEGAVEEPAFRDFLELEVLELYLTAMDLKLGTRDIVRVRLVHRLEWAQAAEFLGLRGQDAARAGDAARKVFNRRVKEIQDGRRSLELSTQRRGHGKRGLAAHLGIETGGAPFTERRPA